MSNLVADGFAVGQRQLALHEVDRVDAVRAFVDRRDAGIAHMLGRPGLLDEAHAAMDLDADRCRLVADVGRERLGDGGEQRRAIGGGRSFGLGRGVVGKVERNAGQVADPARGVDVGLHRHQHALHVGTLDDRGHAVAAFGAAALAALAGVSQRLLIGAVADGHPLRPDREPRRVHHHEHGGEAAVLLADQPGLRALVVAIDHDAGRGAVDAELVFDSRAAQVVAVRRAIRRR